MAAEQKSALKVIKKKWYGIYATPSFDEAMIGESLVAEPNDLVGRIVTINLMSLTNDIKHQSVNLKFKVISAEGEKVIAEAVGIDVIPAAIKRLVRRGVDRIDASFVCETADGKKIRIKPFILTKSYARGLIVRKLRRALIEYVVSEVKKVSFDELIIALISGKLQVSVKAVLKKIYPVKSCEIISATTVLKGKIISVSEKESVEEKKEDSEEEQQ